MDIVRQIHSLFNAGTSLTESAAIRAYNAIFEANAGDTIKRGVKLLCTEYGMNDPAAARELCLNLRHMAFDIFSTRQHPDDSRDPGVVKVLPLYEPVLRMLCEQDHISDNDTGALERMSRFGKHFKTLIKEHGSQVTVKTTVTNPKTKQNRKDLELNGTPLKLSDIMALPVTEDDSLGNAVIKRHTYRIEPILTHQDAVDKYHGIVPWCLTWENETYWNRYSDSGENKCYFLFRDDFDTVEHTTDTHNPEDEYGLSALGMFIAPDGSIAHIYNRQNRDDMMYSKADIEKLVGKPFGETFPPLTEEEHEISVEAVGESLSHEPITRSNFFREFRDFADQQIQRGEFECGSNTVADLGAAYSNFCYDGYSSSTELGVVVITDANDHKRYEMLLGIDDGQYTDDMLTAYTEWLPYENEDGSFKELTDIGDQYKNKRLPLIQRGNTLYRMSDAYDYFVDTLELPDGYYPLRYRSHYYVIQNTVGNAISYPIALFVTNGTTTNILILPDGRYSQPYMLLDEDMGMITYIETRNDDSDEIIYFTDDESDMFNTPQRPGYGDAYGVFHKLTAKDIVNVIEHRTEDEDEGEQDHSHDENWNPDYYNN